MIDGEGAGRAAMEGGIALFGRCHCLLCYCRTADGAIKAYI